MDAPNIGLAVALAAGMISFLSPCVFPLVPSYVTFITGMSLDELTVEDDARERARRAVLVHGTLFVVGFSVFNIILGASATFLGALFFHASIWLERVGGALLIVFGLYLIGAIRLPGANREWRVHLGDKPMGYFGTVLVGVTFGAAWTPCSGPILGAILMYASTEGSVTKGVSLLFLYSLGLALPFLLAALLLRRFLPNIRRVGPWLPWISRASGVILLLLGALMITGSFTLLTALMGNYTPSFILDRI